MPQENETAFYVVREDGSVIMRFFLSDKDDLRAQVERCLDSEQRGRVSFGKPKIGGQDGNDRR